MPVDVERIRLSQPRRFGFGTEVIGKVGPRQVMEQEYTLRRPQRYGPILTTACQSCPEWLHESAPAREDMTRRRVRLSERVEGIWSATGTRVACPLGRVYGGGVCAFTWATARSSSWRHTSVSYATPYA